MNSYSRLAVAVLAGILAVLAAAPAVQAAQPAWHIFGATGPTNVPPTTSEVQEVGVDAAGGSFTLTFDSQTTPPLPFDADADQLETALNGLGSVSGLAGDVVVRGGPGNPGAEMPYFVSFGGGLSGANIAQMGADSSALTGGSETVTVSTKTQGAPVGSAQIAVIATNVGGATTSGTVTLTVGPLPSGITTSGFAEPGNPTFGAWSCPNGAGATVVTCTGSTKIFLPPAGENTALPPGRAAESLKIPITIDGTVAAPLSSVPLSISGGAAASSASSEVSVRVSAEPASPGIQAFWAGAFDEDGHVATQAGGHPAHAFTGFFSNTVLSPIGEIVPAGDLRDVRVELPPGFIGNPLVSERCPAISAPNLNPSGLLCGSDAAMGLIQPLTSYFGSFFPPFPIYNNVPSHGYAAQFTSKIAIPLQALVGSLRSDGDYGVTVEAPNVANYYKVYGSVASFDGNPAGAGGKAFLTNPMSCSLGTSVVTISAATWQEPTVFSGASDEQPAMTGCDKLEFHPTFGFQPSTTEAASVTAATAELSVDQQGLLDPNELAPPHLKKSVVALPEGMNLNPAAANGLQACSTAQIGLRGTNFAAPNPIRFDKNPVSCPDASKLGTVEVVTPLLDDPLDGVVYLAAQGDNPFNSLLAMYLVIEDERYGITIKLPGKVTPDSKTGQLTAEFDNNPQTPFSSLKLSFRGGGPRSPIATPDVCGTYATSGSWTPWSAPESGPPAQTTDSFTIDKGVNGVACPRTKAERPFDLGFSAGTTDPVAGKHSPFTMRITRPDGNQEIDAISATVPPGLLATLKGVEICSDAQVSKASSRNQPGDGAKEISDPSCSSNSQVGTTTIGAGVGSEPIYVKTGKAYLTGPYKSAPASLTFIVPAVAGPFDLGVQVVR
ncbi:MAG TPA: hypothetical protein VK889_02450, partial [Solirubrobacterales bacterium]|nr:hypothetical protein [Solirubrobacterales bacterium]